MEFRVKGNQCYPTMAEFKKLDESIYDVLKAIRRRPGMYIVEPSIYRLQAFLSGYTAGLLRAGFVLPDEGSLGLFQDWLISRLGFTSSTSGWANMIREKSLSDKDAFERFFILLDEFREGAGSQL